MLARAHRNNPTNVGRGGGRSFHWTTVRTRNASETKMRRIQRCLAERNPSKTPNSRPYSIFPIFRHNTFTVSGRKPTKLANAPPPPFPWDTNRSAAPSFSLFPISTFRFPSFRTEGRKTRNPSSIETVCFNGLRLSKAGRRQKKKERKKGRNHDLVDDDLCNCTGKLSQSPFFYVLSSFSCGNPCVSARLCGHKHTCREEGRREEKDLYSLPEGRGGRKKKGKRKNGRRRKSTTAEVEEEEEEEQGTLLCVKWKGRRK